MSQPNNAPLPTSPLRGEELTITRLGGLGDGIAYHEGQTVMVPFTAPGDRVRAKPVRAQKQVIHAELTEILEPSPNRATPPCPYFGTCGGCQLQHVNAQYYHEFKRNLASDAVQQAGYDPALLKECFYFSSASRRRAEFKIEGAAIGYYAAQSHKLVDIAQCLILAPKLQEWFTNFRAQLPELNRDGQITGASVTLADDDAIDLILETPVPPANIPGVARLSTSRGIVYEKQPITIRCGTVKVPLPPGAFLQASREAQDTLTEAVKIGLKGCKNVADLFAGIGAYAYALAGKAKVHAVEGEALVQPGPNLTSERRDLFRKPLSMSELKAYDGVVINPPRAGAEAQCELIGMAKVPNIVMVSCNPATFARDAAILRRHGYSLARAILVDQFVYSAHLEIVARFRYSLKK